MYHIRIRDGDTMLDLLNEQGEVAQYERFALAAIAAKDLIEVHGAQEVVIYFEGLISSTFKRDPATGEAYSED